MKRTYQCQEPGCYSVNTAGYSDPAEREEWMSDNHKLMFHNPREGDRIWCAEHALKREGACINDRLGS